MSKLSVVFMALLFLGGCTRTIDESSSLKIQLPGMSSKIVQTTSSNKVSNKVSSQSVTTWGVASPTLNSEIVCYAVLISNPNVPSSACKDGVGTTIITPSVFAGLYPAGSTLTLDSLPGGASTIHLIGFAASNSSVCVNIGPNGPDTSSLSEPIIVSEASVDIQSGDNVVDMVVPSSLGGLTSFNHCDQALKDENASANGVNAVSISPSAYGLGSSVVASFVFTESVEVTGSPRVEMNVAGSTRYANYISGSGSDTLLFDYTVSAADEDLDGLDIGASIELNGGTILTTAASSNIGLNLPTTNFPSVIVDGVAPSSGSISIESGAATVFSTTVNLDLLATNADEMYITNTAGCATGGTYEPYATTKVWVLGGTNSTQNVYVKYRDNAGNEGPCLNDDIIHQDPALITISETDPYDYGIHPVGATDLRIFTLTNTGAVTTATGLSEVGLGTNYGFAGGSFPGTGGDCATSLGASASCTIAIEFAPIATGVLNDTIEISYNNGAAAVSSTRNVTGTGATPGNLTISSGPTYDFGNIPAGASSSNIFVVSNTGATLTTGMTGSGLAAPYSFTGGAYPGTGGNCGTTLSAVSNCFIEVTYSPVATSASDTDTIELNYNDGVSAQNATRNLTATAVAPASLAFSGVDPYDFGTAATGSVQTTLITLQNNGGFEATSISDAFTLATPFNFTGSVYPGTAGDCGTTLNAGASCNIEIEYAPVSTGANSETLQLDYNDGTAAQFVTLGVQGAGAAPAFITISETDPYDFGSIANLTTISHIFTLQNTGGVAATGISEIGLAAPYQFVGGSFPGTVGDCTTTLTDGASCNIDIEFAPTSAGTFPDNISIQYNDGANIQNSDRLVTGTSIGGTQFSLVAAGKNHTCGVDASNDVYCWGGGAKGQLGFGGTASQSAAVAAIGLSSITGIDSSTDTTCAVNSANDGYCWGDNGFGQIGNSTSGNNEATPVLLPDSATWQKIVVGTYHTCGLKMGGNVKCWGNNNHGQIGNGATGGQVTSPTVVTGGNTFNDIASNGNHVCGIKADSTVMCWGLNTFGQLGNNTTTSTDTPVASTELGSNVTSIAVGGDHTCALYTDNTIKCVGKGTSGQLGNSASIDSQTAVTVSGSLFSSISAGESHTCAVDTSNDLYCWGANVNNQLGDGTSTLSNFPVGAGSNFASVHAGFNHNCAIQQSSNDLYCWGLNNNSQLGDGATTNLSVPTLVNP